MVAEVLFALGPPLVTVNLKDEGLGVKLAGRDALGPLRLARYASGANWAHVTSALLEPQPRNENAAA